MLKVLKEVLAIGGGIALGLFICYEVYRFYKHCSKKKTQSHEDVFVAKLKKKEVQDKKFNDLVANQTYVELLTAKDLTAWFKENRSSVPGNAKMIIIIPTVDNMKGLGYYGDNDLDADTNVVQIFYDEESSEVYKIRLVNFANIESNLQAQLIEQDGMIVVTA